jgi:hypothetical protein
MGLCRYYYRNNLEKPILTPLYPNDEFAHYGTASFSVPKEESYYILISEKGKVTVYWRQISSIGGLPRDDWEKKKILDLWKGRRDLEGKLMKDSESWWVEEDLLASE